MCFFLLSFFTKDNDMRRRELTACPDALYALGQWRPQPRRTGTGRSGDGYTLRINNRRSSGEQTASNHPSIDQSRTSKRSSYVHCVTSQHQQPVDVG